MDPEQLKIMNAFKQFNAEHDSVSFLKVIATCQLQSPSSVIWRTYTVQHQHKQHGVGQQIRQVADVCQTQALSSVDVHGNQVWIAVNRLCELHHFLLKRIENSLPTPNFCTSV